LLGVFDGVLVVDMVIDGVRVILCDKLLLCELLSLLVGVMLSELEPEPDMERLGDLLTDLGLGDRDTDLLDLDSDIEPEEDPVADEDIEMDFDLAFDRLDKGLFDTVGVVVTVNFVVDETVLVFVEVFEVLADFFAVLDIVDVGVMDGESVLVLVLVLLEVGV
jgi:hypothetical protein